MRRPVFSSLISPILSLLALTACGGGGGGDGGGAAVDDEPSLVTQESTIDEALLQRPLLEITSENAKADVIEEVIFGLEFLSEIAAAVAIAPLTSNVAHDLSFDQLSSNFSSYQCIFELVDNDASGDVSDGDRLA